MCYWTILQERKVHHQEVGPARSAELLTTLPVKFWGDGYGFKADWWAVEYGLRCSVWVMAGRLPFDTVGSTDNNDQKQVICFSLCWKTKFTYSILCLQKLQVVCRVFQQGPKGMTGLPFSKWLGCYQGTCAMHAWMGEVNAATTLLLPGAAPLLTPFLAGSSLTGSVSQEGSAVCISPFLLCDSAAGWAVFH